MNLSTVSRDDLPLLFAMIEHRAWIRWSGETARRRQKARLERPNRGPLALTRSDPLLLTRIDPSPTLAVRPGRG
jgi:hypothetical protein